MSAKQTVYIKAPDGKREQITMFQNAKEIIQQMMRAELNSRGTSKKLAALFREPTARATAAKVWYFMRNELKYVAEPQEEQTAKTIRKIIADAKKGNDCKHYATFAVGVLNACGIPTIFTLAGQDVRRRKPNHAYATSIIDGKRVVIDACRKYFDSECEHYYRWDYKRK